MKDKKNVYSTGNFVHDEFYKIFKKTFSEACFKKTLSIWL